MTPPLGELAGLFTSLCFSFTSMFFTLAGRRVGSVVVNRTRLLLALGFLVPTHWVLLQTALPLQVEPRRWFWLGLSGLVGLVLGDAFLFQAFVWIGPRLSMLLMSLVPVLSAILAWLALGEQLAGTQILGMALTLAGVTWVVTERRNGGPPEARRNYLLGILFGLGGATGQALGLITAKFGLGGDVSPLSGTLIRMLTAAAILWGLTLLRGRAPRSVQAVLQQPRAGLLILAGAFTGPFLGVTSSLLAVQRAQVGVASTLMALPPIFLLPIGALVFGEQVGWRAVSGTLLALAGVAVLFLL